MRELIDKINLLIIKAFAAIKSEKGQALVEYALLVVFIAIVVYLMVKGTGREVNCIWSTVNSALGDT
jgi:pilus assembly protein Flp/PilA